MKKLFFLPLLFVFTAFMCESDDAVTDAEADSLLFPDVACGSMAVEIDGILSVYSDFTSGIVSQSTTCRMILNANNEGPGVENRFVSMVISAPAVGTYILEETGISDEFCEFTRIVWQYLLDTDADGGLESQFGYSSRPVYGGEGYLEITELELNFEDDLPDFISGQFEFTAGVFFDETGAAPETVTIRGSFCEIPIIDNICDTGGIC
ncbi:DUF6252 family protein [Gilvibacter sp.]|uniref:DUF6252 family protein n=1 Tax=Gilvibacter sp. TaxID=2729997 RepID=UPI0025B7EBFD|nr:DUF6252 family protein [Gilvibacter sp.]NQX78378.1 hypothetical protein [Gilvibacter sp.]